MKRLQILAFLLSATALNAIAGTVSPDLSAMPPGSPVQVIVQYSSPLGGLVSGVCGVLQIALLPVGELCSTTAANALALAQNPLVSHVSINHLVQGTGQALPVYDYMPQTIQPLTYSGGQGAGVGVAVIDSGIHVNNDLLGGFLNLVPTVVWNQSFVPGEVPTITMATERT